MLFILGVSYKNSLTVSWLVGLFMAFFAFLTFHTGEIQATVGLYMLWGMDRV